jgi:hypothetical protein
MHVCTYVCVVAHMCVYVCVYVCVSNIDCLLFMFFMISVVFWNNIHNFNHKNLCVCMYVFKVECFLFFMFCFMFLGFLATT